MHRTGCVLSDRDAALQHVRVGDVQLELRLGHLQLPALARLHARPEAVRGSGLQTCNPCGQWGSAVACGAGETCEGGLCGIVCWKTVTSTWVSQPSPGGLTISYSMVGGGGGGNANIVGSTSYGGGGGGGGSSAILVGGSLQAYVAGGAAQAPGATASASFTPAANAQITVYVGGGGGGGGYGADGDDFGGGGGGGSGYYGGGGGSNVPEDSNFNGTDPGVGGGGENHLGGIGRRLHLHRRLYFGGKWPEWRLPSGRRRWRAIERRARRRSWQRPHGRCGRKVRRRRRRRWRRLRLRWRRR